MQEGGAYPAAGGYLDSVAMSTVNVTLDLPIKADVLLAVE
jgi:hypothetical protein